MRDWQADAPRAIASIHAQMPEATPEELRKALRKHSQQFSYGTSWGAKVWQKHCRAYLARMAGRGDFRSDGKAIAWPADIHFPFRGGEA